MTDPANYRPASGTIPTQPGVYRFIDADDQVIYVGKAKNLRARLTSYFGNPDGLHFRTQLMVRTAARVEWNVVQNEFEALQLEYTFIKKYDPKFNVIFRDDKSYPWLAITWSDEYPRVFVGRGAKRKGWRYFGPYPVAWAVREKVDLLLRAFPMRSCRDAVFRSAERSGRPCLLGQIGKCSAPCVGWVDAAKHRAIVTDFASYISGHSERLVRQLNTEMRAAAAAEEFERAAKLRDALSALARISEHNAIVLPDNVFVDCVALAESDLEVAVCVFHIRGGQVAGQRSWVADRADDASVAELTESFLLQLYAATDTNVEIPSEVLVPAAPPECEALQELLAEVRGTKVRVRVPQRGDKHTLLDTVAKNAAEVLARHQLRRASDLFSRGTGMAELQQALGLSEVPLRIECYDISHLQGTEVVGSMVVFEDGAPRKSEYRRFVIKSFEGANDTLAMDEVLRRRFRRLLDDRTAMSAAAVEAAEDGSTLIDQTNGAPRRFIYAPQLVVVDGGLPQVHAAQAVLDDLGISEVALLGLAKRLEEVWVPGEQFPIILPRTSEGLYLLQRLRDEAHRFAITHHRNRRSRAMVESMLDDVPGLGEVRRKTLLGAFGSLAKLRKASAADIAALPGFGAQTATAVKLAVSATSSSPSLNTATGEVHLGADEVT
ncbi:MAG: excinuclease ABC subunit UvrC [Propionibacteriaceae bacterium]|jgi:excinuclease ABC subunit C|nr:excinuclease ABC subunit UvrC [Propionibacteriaceae bacterium]